MTDSENLNLLCRSKFSFQPIGLIYNIFIFHNDPYIGVDKVPTYTTQLWAPFHAVSRTYTKLKFVLCYFEISSVLVKQDSILETYWEIWE
jgi:hypothetical protein